MTKTRKKMLVSSTIMLLVAAISLSSATFAWFTAGKTASVSKMNFKTSSSQGILISANAIDFKSTLTATDLAYTGNSNALNTKLEPVSSVGDVDTTTEGKVGTLKLFSGTMANDLLVTTAEDASSTGKYWMMDLYVLNSGSEDKNIYLDLANCLVEGYDSDTTDTVDEKTGIEKAVRFGFINEGTGVTGTTTQTVALVKAANAGTSAKIYEPNDTEHTAFAKAYRYVVGTDGATTDNLVGSNTTLPYVGIKAAYGDSTAKTGISLAKGAAANAYTVGTTVYSAVVSTVKYVSSGTTTVKGIDLGTIAANKITKLKVYVWLEGQDVDCNNKESGGSVQFTLAFTTENPDGTAA